MIYNGRLTPPNHWPPLIRYPQYYPDRRLSLLWFLALAIVSLTLSVIALIIVFAVDHSWFHDSFSGSLTRYGLWRLCFFGNDSCTSWFAPGETYSALVDQRLNVSRVGINAWQALEIIFLFLTVATLFIAIVSIVCYRFRNSLHYYTAILAVFCVWPAASVGVSALFVFGFAVYNVSPSVPTRDLDWCFYVNLVAVILAVIAAILLSIYDTLLKKPLKTADDDTIVETFADLNGYPATLSPSTFVIVRRNKNKRNRPYEYPQILHPSHYFPTDNPNIEYRSNPNHQMATPYTSVVTTQETTTTNTQQRQLPPPPPPPPPPPLTPYRGVEYNRSNHTTSPMIIANLPQPPFINETQPFHTPVSSYQYQSRASSPHWHRTGTNAMNRSIGYASEPTHEYVQRSLYQPNRSNTVERRFEKRQEPRVLHYYTGYDYFATADPSDAVLTRHHPPIIRPVSSIRYDANPSYYHESDYIKSSM